MVSAIPAALETVFRLFKEVGATVQCTVRCVESSQPHAPNTLPFYIAIGFRDKPEHDGLYPRQHGVTQNLLEPTLEGPVRGVQCALGVNPFVLCWPSSSTLKTQASHRSP